RYTKIYILFFKVRLLTSTDSTCSLPSDWDGTWYDASFPSNNVIFDQASQTVTSGWSIRAYNSDVTSWTCQSQDTSNNLLLFKGNQFVDLFGADQNAFRCIKWTKLSDYSYVYFIYANSESNARYTGTTIAARVLIEAYDAAVTSWATSTYCNPSNGLPGTEEYVVMVRQGYETQVSQYCSTPFLITAAYTHNDGSSTTCGTGSVWDVCSDRTQMAVNLTQCSTKQYYSADGNAVCVYSTSSGSTYYQTVLNTDTSVDYSTTYRLTCYAVTTSGSNVVASDSLGACEAGQSPTTKATDGTGTLTFTPYTFTTDTDSSSSSSSLGIIIGIVVALILIIAIIIIIICVIKKLKRKAKTHNDDEKKKNPPDDMVLETFTPRDDQPITDRKLPPLDNKVSIPPSNYEIPLIGKDPLPNIHQTKI
ncbi:hypothetical protein FSP39_008703, partial [Pinctada imbricata]